MNRRRLIVPAWGLALALVAQSNAQVNPTVHLSRPAGESLPHITGVYWKFDQAENQVVQDFSGNQYNGKIENPVNQSDDLVDGVDLSGCVGYGKGVFLLAHPDNPTEQRNGRVVFNYGTTDITVNRLNLSDTDFTIGLWFKFDRLPGKGQRAVLVSKGTIDSTKAGGNYGILLERNGQGDWRLRFTLSDGQEIANVTTPYGAVSVGQGQWNHVGVTFAFRPGDTNEATLWWNGVNIASGNPRLAPAPGDATLGARTLSVGERASSTWFSNFEGAVDDFFITEGQHPFTPPAP